MPSLRRLVKHLVHLAAAAALVLVCSTDSAGAEPTWTSSLVCRGGGLLDASFRLGDAGSRRGKKPSPTLALEAVYSFRRARSERSLGPGECAWVGRSWRPGDSSTVRWQLKLRQPKDFVRVRFGPSGAPQLKAYMPSGARQLRSNEIKAAGALLDPGQQVRFRVQERKGRLEAVSVVRVLVVSERVLVVSDRED